MTCNEKEKKKKRSTEGVMSNECQNPKIELLSPSLLSPSHLAPSSIYTHFPRQCFSISVTYSEAFNTISLVLNFFLQLCLLSPKPLEVTPCTFITNTPTSTHFKNSLTLTLGHNPMITISQITLPTIRPRSLSP